MERDARTLNRMGADAKLIHLRLEVWARWSKENVQSWRLGSRQHHQPNDGLRRRRSLPLSGAPVEMPEPIARNRMRREVPACR